MVSIVLQQLVAKAPTLPPFGQLAVDNQTVSATLQTGVEESSGISFEAQEFLRQFLILLTLLKYRQILYSHLIEPEAKHPGIAELVSSV